MLRSCVRRVRPRRTAFVLRNVNVHTHIEKIVRDSIKATGPMSVSTYMQLCLGHPTHGYYMNPSNPVFGSKGDFITSPEISQVFGELVAIWHLSRWIAAGQPKRIRLVELGPGRGTLAADALRTCAQFPAAREALRIGDVHLVESSDAMRRLQEQTLRRGGLWGLFEQQGEGEFVQWHAGLEEVKNDTVDRDTFTMVVAHEFFDALPVHVLEKKQTGWHELLISPSPSPSPQTILSPSSPSPSLPPLHLTRSPSPSTLSTLLGALSPRYAALPPDSRLEVSPTSFKLARTLAELVNDPRGAGGSALVIDYGPDGISGHSLRAFKKHKIVDIFDTPGECDLTANVDFALLKEAMSDAATVHGPISQRDFLKNMGIDIRVGKLTTNKADPKDKEEIARAARRLVDPTGMGVQYKVLGVTGTGAREGNEREAEVWPFVVPPLAAAGTGKAEN